MCKEYLDFYNDLQPLCIPKDRIDQYFEDGYSAREAIDDWEWEQDMDMHEWASNRKAELTEKGLF